MLPGLFIRYCLVLILSFIFKTGAFYEPEIDLPCCSYSTRLYYVRIFATGKMTIQARFSTVYKNILKEGYSFHWTVYRMIFLSINYLLTLILITARLLLFKCLFIICVSLTLLKHLIKQLPNRNLLLYIMPLRRNGF